jgi:hypothetical protein
MLLQGEDEAGGLISVDDTRHPARAIAVHPLALDLPAKSSTAEGARVRTFIDR